MRKFIVLIILLLICVVSVEAQRNRRQRRDRYANEMVENVDSLLDKQFSSTVFKTYNEVIPYRDIKINQDDSGKSILVVYLHGRSASGSDNRRQLGRKGVSSILDYIEAQQLKACFLVPQCPSYRKWNERDQGGAEMTAQLKYLIDCYIKENDIDTARIYILGDSAGASGVWRMASDYPDFFAAVMPVASVPRGVDEKQLCSTPIMTVVGEKDEMVTPEIVGKTVSNIEKNGGLIQFDILLNQNHREACDNAFTATRLQWLLSHIKG